MKKILSLAAACFFVLAANAQYFPTQKGTVLQYTSTFAEENVSVTSTETVTAIETAADGVISGTFETTAEVPGNEFAKTTIETTATYNPATKATTIVSMDAATFKKYVTEMVIKAAESSGHMVTDAEREELDKNLNPKGTLKIEINPEAAPGTSVPDCTLSMNMGQGRMLIKWSKIVFVGFEEITVPAGTFNCAKFTYVSTEIMGEAPEKKFYTEWFAEGVGTVKQVAADKKGNVKEEEVLTALTPAV